MDFLRRRVWLKAAVLASAFGLVATAAPTAARAQTPGEEAGEVPANVRGALGDRAERVDRRHYRVQLADGKTLLTHGPDAAVADAVEDLSPGSPERAPVCAADNRMHILYGRLTSQTNRYATVKPQIQSAVRRMNNVLNDESLESGGKAADFRVRCDTAGQIEVGQFTSGSADFSAVASAARAAGFNAARTNYTIFFDASSSPGTCGVGSYWEDERLTVNNSNNQGGGYAVSHAGCWNGRTPMHEASHNLGAVQYSSPYSTGTGAHCRDGSDVMCYSDGGDRDTGMISRCTDRMHYDCGHDDYFDSTPEPGEYLASHWNIGSSLNRFINFGTATTVRGWGLNYDGELGSGTGVTTTTPVQAMNLSAVKQVSAGGFHSLALKEDGTVWAFGFNNVGQVGDNSLTSRLAPVQVPGLAGVTAVSAGYAHSLALKSDGTAWAWGWNPFAQLGDGTKTDRLLPVQVGGLTGVTAISAGTGHNLAVLSDGTVRSWGLNHAGQLGNGSTVETSSAPVPVVGLTTVKQVSAGGYHSLAVRTDGSTWAWGFNHAGQLGTGLLAPSTSLPVAVPGMTGVAEVAGGYLHTLARKSDGTVWAWGSNVVGQLGVGSLLDVWSPAQIPVAGAIGLAAGYYHSLVLRSDRAVLGWGWGGYGQLGIIATLLNPTGVVLGTNVQAITTGVGHSLTLVA